MRALGQLPDFQEYLRVCRTHQLVGKNDLSALLIAPMQHQCRYQLMLEVSWSLGVWLSGFVSSIIRKYSSTLKINLKRSFSPLPLKPLWFPSVSCECFN